MRADGYWRYPPEQHHAGQRKRGAKIKEVGPSKAALGQANGHQNVHEGRRDAFEQRGILS